MNQKGRIMTRRVPSQYNWDKLLFDESILNKHYTSKSYRNIKFVVIHHMVIKDKDVNAPDALDACYNVWQSRAASAHYGVDGRFVRQFVYDTNIAWGAGNTIGNQHGIHIEHVNKTLDEKGTANDYLVSEETWKNGARLAAYIHKRHGLGRPVKDVTIRKHNSFKATACPGPFLGGEIWNTYVKEAQRVYDEITKTKAPSKPAVTPEFYTVKKGDTLVSVAKKYGTTWATVSKLNGGFKKGFKVGMKIRLKPAVKSTKKKSVATIAKEVIKGKWGNGTTRTTRLRKAGYSPAAVQKEVNRLLKK